MTTPVLRLLIARVRGLFGGRDDPDFEDELRGHLGLLTERYVRQGMSPEKAAQAARRQFGNTTLLREERRQMRTIPTLESLWHDCRHAARMLRKNRTFTATVLLTLALGIGANTAIFSICNAVLLKPLPYADPDRIVMLWEQMGNGTLIPVSPANFVDWRQQTRSFSAVAAINAFRSFVLTGSGDPVRLTAAAVSFNFFTVLGTPITIGRDFLPEEDHPGRDRVAILAHATWIGRFGGRPDVLGKTVTLSDTSYTVVGVLPRDFEFVARAADYQARTRFDVWVPLALNPTPSRGTHSLRVFARLDPKTDLALAQADVDVLGANLARAYPEENNGKGIRAVALRQQVTADVRPALFTLLGAVGFVLAIACANVANLLLTRGASRQKETSLRLAIGASRARIAQQLLVESALLGVLGGSIGLAVALAATRGAVPYLPPDLSRAAGVALDWRVLLFTAVISLATGVLFGLAPLFQARRVNASESLSHGMRVAGGLQTRLRSSLVVAQVAITLILLIGAGLMARSLVALLQVPLGFRSDQILTARVTLPSLRYPDAARVGAFQRDLLERLRNSPGVQSAAATAYLPLSGDDNGWAVHIEGRPPRPVGVFDFATYRPVSDGYFETIGIPTIRGRGFNPSDDQDAPLVVVISESMARAYWGEQDPVGKRLRFGGPAMRTVIGIVGDVRHDGPEGAARREMYLPLAQARGAETAPTIVVRTAIDPSAMTSILRTAVSATDASVPIDRVRTMEQFVSASVGQPRFRTFLLTALSILALVMASVGIYGVTNYAVVQRTREFGIHLAVGATAADVLRLVLGRAAVLILAGLGLGLLASLALTRLISGLLYGVTALDSQTFLVVSLLLFGVASLASYVPARRATRIDPVVALRDE